MKSFLVFYSTFLDIGKIKIPVVAAIKGNTIGGGLGIALMCDIRIADSKVKLGATFTRLGLHSGMAVSYILPRLVGLAKANELLFTGRMITGEVAEIEALYHARTFEMEDAKEGISAMFEKRKPNF